MMMLGVNEEGQMRRASRSKDLGSRTGEDQGLEGRVEGAGQVRGGPGQGMAGTQQPGRGRGSLAMVLGWRVEEPPRVIIRA